MYYLCLYLYFHLASVLLCLAEPNSLLLFAVMACTCCAPRDRRTKEVAEALNLKAPTVLGSLCKGAKIAMCSQTIILFQHFSCWACTTPFIWSCFPIHTFTLTYLFAPLSVFSKCCSEYSLLTKEKSPVNGSRISQVFYMFFCTSSVLLSMPIKWKFTQTLQKHLLSTCNMCYLVYISVY